MLAHQFYEATATLLIEIVTGRKSLKDFRQN